MKRSEVVYDVIEPIIYEYLKAHKFDMPKQYRLELANDILSACEDAGMLPPSNTNDTNWVMTPDELYEWDSEDAK